MDRNKSRSRSTLVIGGLVALAVGALAAPRHVRAQEVSAARVRYDFQSVGFVHGQTIRVSVASLIPPPIGDLPPPVPDRVRVFVLDARGERLADSGPVLFPPGPTFVFDVPRAKLGPNGGGRHRPAAGPRGGHRLERGGFPARSLRAGRRADRDGHRAHGVRTVSARPDQILAALISTRRCAADARIARRLRLASTARWLFASCSPPGIRAHMSASVLAGVRRYRLIRPCL